jgi:hypothetical protein
MECRVGATARLVYRLCLNVADSDAVGSSPHDFTASGIVIAHNEHEFLGAQEWVGRLELRPRLGNIEDVTRNRATPVAEHCQPPLQDFAPPRVTPIACVAPRLGGGGRP